MKIGKQSVTISLVSAALGAGGMFLMSGGGGSGEGADLPGIQRDFTGRRENRGVEDRASRRTTLSRSARKAAENLNPIRRKLALCAYYDSLEPDQLAEEFERLSELPDNLRYFASEWLSEAWGASDPLGAAAHFDEHGRPGDLRIDSFITSWASMDPLGCANYYLANSGEFAEGGSLESQFPSEVPGRIVSSWVAQDPDGALEWSFNIEPKPGEIYSAGEALEEVVNHYMKGDRAGLLDRLREMPDGFNKRHAERLIALSWKGQDLEAGMEWIQTLPEDRQDHLAWRLVARAGAADVARAMEITETIRDPEARDWALANVAKHYLGVDRDKALELFSEVESEDVRHTMDYHFRGSRGG